MEEDRRVFLTVRAKNQTVTLVAQLFIEREQKESIRNFYNLVVSNSDVSYKSTKFSRIISPEFIIQGGSIEEYQGDLTISDEFTPESTALNEKGLIALASGRAQEGSSEFFITLDDLSEYASLQERFLVVGKVISGLDQLVEITKGIDVDLEDRPVEDVVIVRTGELVKKKKKPDEKVLEKPVEEDGEVSKLKEEVLQRDTGDSRRRNSDRDRYEHSRSHRHHYHSSRSTRDRSRERTHDRDTKDRHPSSHNERSYRSRDYRDSDRGDSYKDRSYDRSYRPNYHSRGGDYMDRDPKRLKSSSSRSNNQDEVRKGRGFRH